MLIVRSGRRCILNFAIFASLVLVEAGNPARAADITFLCAEALETAMHDLVPEFEKTSGHKVNVRFANSGTNAGRVRKGDAADLAIVLPPQWESLQQEGKIDPAVRAVVGKVGLGIFVRKGVARPDIGSVEAFKRMLLNVRSIAVRDPAQRSPVGTYAIALFDRLGLGGELNAKIRLTPGRPFPAVVNGEADVGFSTMAEIAASPEVDLVGPLPADIQNFNVFTAAIPVNAKEPAGAKTLIDFLVSPRAALVLRSKGVEPR